MKLTQKQLNSWNVYQNKQFGISYNENVNTANGLPTPEVRQYLRKLHNHLYGICNPSGKVSMKQFKDSIGVL